MGRKTKFPLRNLFYWGIFCIVLSLLLIPGAKASLLSDVSNAKDKNLKRPTISFTKKAAWMGKMFVNDVKDLGNGVGNAMDAVGAAFESMIRDGENGVVGLASTVQGALKEKIGKASIKAATPARADQKAEDSLKAKTAETKVVVKNQITASFLQDSLEKIKNASKKAVDAGANFGANLADDVKDFNATVGGTMESVGSTFESVLKEGTDSIIGAVDAAQKKIGGVFSSDDAPVSNPPAVKNTAVQSGVIVGPKQKTTDNGLQTTATTNKTSDTMAIQTKKAIPTVTPTAVSKPQLTVYSNADSTTKNLTPNTNNKTQTITEKKADDSKTETETAANNTNETTTLQNVKVIGTIDFSEAKVAGLQQTVVNNYSSGPTISVYNTKDQKYEDWTMTSGAGGGVSHGFSVGTNLTVGNSSDYTSGDISATRNITAGGNVTVSGSGSFGGLTIASLTSSGNSSVSGTLQVTNTTTLYNDLLVGAAAESIADPGFIFNGNDAYFHDKIGVNGIAYFDGVMQSSSTLLVGTAAGTDNLFVNGQNTYVATSTAYGTGYSLIVGNGTTGAVIAGGHVAPSHTNLFDLGRNGLGWANLYASSTIYTGAGGTSLTTLNPNSLAFAGSSGVVSSTAGNLRLAADGTNQLQFWTNNNQRAYIDSSGNTFASGTLQATNTTTLYNDLILGITAASHLTGTNNLLVNGQSEFDGTAFFDGSLRVSSTLLLTNAATFYSDVTLGDAAGDTITINGRLSALNVSDGLTATSSLANNSLAIRKVIGTFDSGYFNVDSSGNVSATGSLKTFGNVTSTGNLYALSGTASTSILNGSSLTLGQGTTGYNSGMFNVDSNGNVSASGTISMPVNSSPAFTFVGDSDTGVGSGGSDNLNLYTAGTSRVALTNSYFILNNFPIIESDTYSLQIGGRPANTAAAIANKIGAFSPTLTVPGSKIVSFYNDGWTTERAAITASGTPIFGIDTGFNLGKFNTDINGNVSATGSLKTFGNVTSTGIIYASGGLISSASSTFSSSLNVDSLSVVNNLRASSTLLVGTAAGTDNLFVNGATTYVSTSTVNANYSLVVGNNSGGGAIIAGGHVSPSHTGLFDLGRNGLGWNNIYSSSTVYTGSGGTSLSTLSPNILAFAGSLGVVSSTAGNLRLAADGTNQLQFWTNNNQRAYIDSSGNIFASGTLQVTNTTTLYNDMILGITIAGHLTGTNNLLINGQSEFDGTSWFDGSLRASSTLLGTGNATFYGDTTLGDAAGDTITINGRLSALNVSDGLTATSSLANNSLAIRKVIGTFDSGYFNVDSSGNVSATGSLKTFGNVTSTGNLYALSGTASTSILNGSSLTLGQGTTGYNSGMFRVASNGDITASGTLGIVGAVNFTGTAVTTTIAGGLVVDTNTLVADATQNKVAIGTATVDPYGKLTISASGGTVPAMTLIDTQSQGATWYIDNGYGPVAASAGTMGFRTGSNIPLFFTSGNNLSVAYSVGFNKGRFAIDSSGNVTVSGTLAFTNTSGGAVSSTAGDLNLEAKNSALSAVLKLFSNGTEMMRMGTGGGGSANGIQFGVAPNYNTGVFNIDQVTGNTFTSGTLAFTNTAGGTVSSTAGDLRFSADNSTNNAIIKFLGGTGGETELLRVDSSAGLSVGVGGPGYNNGVFIVNNQNGNITASGTLAFTNTAAGVVSSTNGILRFQALAPPIANTPEFEFWNGGVGAVKFLTIGMYQAPNTASTTFTSYIPAAMTGPGTAGFVFNTLVGAGAMASTTGALDRALLVVQNNGVNQFVVSPGGNVYADESFIANSTDYGIADVAEYVNLTTGETGEPGDVLVVDPSNPNRFKKSSSSYSKNIAGVVSDTGAFIMGASGEGRVPLGLAGLVRVKVTDENGPISIGDYLVSASLPGYAMKFDENSGQSAGLVGMALEPLANGEDRIAIMVNKGLINGENNTAALTVSENNDGTIASNLDFGNQPIFNVKSINNVDNLWYINENGLLVVKDIKADSVQAKKFVVKKKNDAKQTSVGEATILINSTLVKVENELVTSTSKIFITFRSNPNSFWWISQQEDGWFEVSLSKLSETDLTFDYWIIGTENADSTNAVEDVENVEVVEDDTYDTSNPAEPASEETPTENPEEIVETNQTEGTSEAIETTTEEPVTETEATTEETTVEPEALEPVAEPESNEPAPETESTTEPETEFPIEPEPVESITN